MLPLAHSKILFQAFCLFSEIFEDPLMDILMCNAAQNLFFCPLEIIFSSNVELDICRFFNRSKIVF